MKCPQCGQWNRASLPRCVRCGAELPREEAEKPAWRDTLADDQSGKEYLRVDEDGQVNDDPDSRDVLAEEMSALKQRKDIGTEKLRTLRQYRARHSADHAAPVVHVEEAAFTAPQEKAEEEEAPAHGRSGRGRKARETSQVENPRQWQDSRSYDPIQDQLSQDNVFQQRPNMNPLVPPKSRRVGRRRMIRVLMGIVFALLVVLCVFFGTSYFRLLSGTGEDKSLASVTASIMNDLAAHTILIPGQDGQQIYIKELRTSYVVAGGFATIEIPDYTWYNTLESVTEETMSVTLTPYIKTSSGRQQPMEPITYDITIPLSPISLINPDGLRAEVTTPMYSMSLMVRPGSTVFINDKDVSDTVNKDGELLYNATVQPIGDNNFHIVVRSPYCRENSLDVVLYRATQEIPLDLAATTYGSTSSSTLEIFATTLPGANVEILTPHSDLKITNLNSTGEFSFIAIFDHIGNNTISITASYPGKKTSQVDYIIYYLPNPDVYTPKAWPLNRDAEYAELVGNITARAAKAQIYVVYGTVDHFVSEKPQMAVIYTSDDKKNRPVLLENKTKYTWKLGESYAIYADVYGTYNNMPWLVARYTYLND